MLTNEVVAICVVVFVDLQSKSKTDLSSCQEEVEKLAEKLKKKQERCVMCIMPLFS